jgi:cobalt-zinc-cadmium efflux system membrane fusion protein
MSRATSPSRLSRRAVIWLVAAGVTAVLAGGAWMTRDRWLSRAADGGKAASANGSAPKPAVEPGEDHDHAHAGGKADAIEVSATGLKNIGFQATTVALRPFERTETIPAIVIERPGRTQVHVTAPFTGVLTEILVGEGQAVEPGAKLFEIRMTHEELVTAQQDYLKTIENLNVVDRELARLQSLGEGVIAGKRIIEQQYEKQKLEASLRAAEQALLLHGLTVDQVAEIRTTRQLLRTFTVRAPAELHTGDTLPSDHYFHVQRLPVSPGQQIEAGQELCVLADHCELYVEGSAFEDDAERLRKAAREGWSVSAKLLSDDAATATINDLKLLYLADHVEPESRAFRFYLPLPNEVVMNKTTPEGGRFIEWRFKPGQRMELSVPVERWDDRIVLPADAVVEEGAEKFVYRQNGKTFERVPVHVEYRDGKAAVVTQGDGLFPGDVVAGKGAYQMHLQLKNKSGGGVDPHAGHNH